MKIFYTDHFPLPLPEGHRFPIEKYTLLRKRIMEAKLVGPDGLCVPHAATDEEIVRVHEPGYLHRVRNGQFTPKELRRIGFPFSAQFVERSRRSCGATIEACRAALNDGIAAQLAGGTHHAFRDRGEGYCVFNDSAIAARALQAEDLVRRVAVIDCDVHQGNGTAAIFADDPSVFTVSIHGRNNFPYHKEKSDLDVDLEDGTGDSTYLDALERGLRDSLRLARAEMAIYIAGADPYAGDRYGRLALTRAGLEARDRMVLEYCREAGIPVAVTMAGGYARPVEATVDIHFQTVKVAVEMGGDSDQ